VCLEAALSCPPANLAVYESAVSAGGAISAGTLRAIAGALQEGNPGRALAGGLQRDERPH
jgi:hypothetical protein